MTFIPEPDEIEFVRRIVNVTSTSEVESRINANISDAGWEQMQLDINEWKKLIDKHTKIDTDGIKIDKNENRLDIRNRVRIALGYPEVNSYGENVGQDIFFFPGATITRKSGW